jgi:hypothetical protein
VLLQFAISGAKTGKTAAHCKEIIGNDVRQFRYSEDLLAIPELDAMIIATGDFQYAKSIG